jgi:hypothetical protein
MVADNSNHPEIAAVTAHAKACVSNASMIVDIYLVVNEVDVHHDELPSYPQA